MVKIKLPGVYAKEYVSKKKGTVTIYYYHRATGVSLPSDPLSSAFISKLAELEKAPAQPTRLGPSERTLGDLIKRFKASDRYMRLRATTRSEYDRHMTYMEKLRDQPVSGFTALHGDALRAKYTEMGHSALGDAVVRTLSVLLSFAVKPLGWILVNPLFGPSQGEKRRRSEVGQRPYEEHEIEAFRRQNPLGSRARLAFEIDLSAGVRISDLPEVSREDVLNGSITIITKKSGSLVVAPATEMARDALLAWEDTRRAHQGAKFKPSRYAISTLDGAKIGKRRISDELAKAYVSAGFDEKQRTHALRYTAAARLFEMGFHFDDIADLIGHAGAEMTRQYLIKKRNARLVKRMLDTIGPSVIDPAQPPLVIASNAAPAMEFTKTSASQGGSDLEPAAVAENPSAAGNSHSVMRAKRSEPAG